MSKELEFIKNFNKITTSGICKDQKIDMSNMYKRDNVASAKIVKHEIEKQYTNILNNCYMEENESGDV